MLSLILSAFPADADEVLNKGPVSVKTGVDRETMYIGDRVKYFIEVETSDEYDIDLPEFGENLADFSIKDFGSDEGGFFGKKTYEQWYILDVYETGDFTMPAVVVKYRIKGEEEWKEILADEVQFKVMSSLDDEALKGDIKDIKGPVSHWDKTYIYILLSIVAVIVLILFLIVYFQKRRSTKEIEIPAVPAHEIAYEALKELLKKDYISSGRIQEYYFELSNIVRHYIENRFELKAPEMTTEEFLITLRNSDVLSTDQKGLVKEFLSHCDMVKFARYHPEKKEIDSSYESARNLVDQTREHASQVVNT